MNRAKEAENIFTEGLNCCQATSVVYSQALGIDKELLLKLGAGFGGGARSGELCGAVTGAIMILGLKHFNSVDKETKAYTHSRVRAFEEAFEKAQGSIVCKDILGYDIKNEEDMKKIMEQNLFLTVCPKAVFTAVQILEEMGI